MASRDRKKSEKKGSKKNDENINKNKNSVSTSLSEEQTEPPAIVDIIEVVEEVQVKTPESRYDEPTLSELIVSHFEGEKVKGLYEGEGQVYFINDHHYKGMFSEGYMHGQGGFVWSDGVIYEGDFLKNQITGKGKYTWQDGSTYVGDVLNGKRHGYGTFQSSDNTVSYTGDWNHGFRHGQGRMDYDIEGKSYYNGEWANGIKHGWGTRQYKSGNIYTGMWFNNVRHGEGTMKWLDIDQIYIGHWENGIQHGKGQHIWLLRRAHNTQYQQRNMYSGEFVNGRRHGEGVFHYANGAKYEGHWKDNKKHGKGKFTFKNGRIYEGMFDGDHIVEFPDFIMDGTMSPDLSQIRTRTPVPADNASVHSNESRNTYSPSICLDIDSLLASLAHRDKEDEANQVMRAITRHVSALHRIYNFYSTLGHQESPDNTFIMRKMQFWLFLKDIFLHYGKYTLTDMDRAIGANYQKPSFELHNPNEKILQRQFVNYLVILAHMMFGSDYVEKEQKQSLLDYCFSRLMRENVLCNACKIKSPVFSEARLAANALIHMDQAYQVYQAVCTPRKKPPKEPVLKMREFLFLLKDLNLINEDLTPEAVIHVLGLTNPNVSDGEGSYNLELEMTFLEFFEALIDCAEIFVTDKVVQDPQTPCQSVLLPQEQEEVSRSFYPFQVEPQKEAEENGEIQIQASQVSAGLLSEEEVAVNMPGIPLNGKLTFSVGALSQQSPAETQTQTTTHKKNSTSAHDSKESGVGLNELQKKASVRSTCSPKSPKDSHVSVQSYPSFQMVELEVMGSEEALVAEETYVMEEEEVEPEEELLLLDEDTRKFNIWTHQVHIFLVRKFFPRVEKYLEMRRTLEKMKLEEARRKSRMFAEITMTERLSEAGEGSMHSQTHINRDFAEEAEQ